MEKAGYNVSRIRAAYVPISSSALEHHAISCRCLRSIGGRIWQTYAIVHGAFDWPVRHRASSVQGVFGEVASEVGGSAYGNDRDARPDRWGKRFGS